MLTGMTVKIAVSLPDELVAHAKEVVRAGREASVSAYLAGALTERVRLERLESLLDEMLEETGGPLSDAERSDADRQLDS